MTCLESFVLVKNGLHSRLLLVAGFPPHIIDLTLFEMCVVIRCRSTAESLISETEMQTKMRQRYTPGQSASLCIEISLSDPLQRHRFRRHKRRTYNNSNIIVTGVRCRVSNEKTASTWTFADRILESYSKQCKPNTLNFVGT